MFDQDTIEEAGYPLQTETISPAPSSKVQNRHSRAMDLLGFVFDDLAGRWIIPTPIKM